MASAPPGPRSVWAVMDYTPPRGKCNFKSGLMSGTCSCLRFMLHPIKAESTFECDGCSHHASYHSMENPSDDAVLKRWSEQGKALRDQDRGGGAGHVAKRKRIASGSGST